MGRKAKHHYVPKCYLKEFTEGGENSSLFWCVPINNDPPFQTSPNDSCAIRDYYTVQHSNSLIVENWYAEIIEPQISKAIEHIKKHASLPIQEEMQYLTLLLATLYLRVPSFRGSMELPMRQAKKIIDSMSKDIKISNKDVLNYTQTGSYKV